MALAGFADSQSKEAVLRLSLIIFNFQSSHQSIMTMSLSIRFLVSVFLVSHVLGFHSQSIRFGVGNAGVAHYRLALSGVKQALQSLDTF